MQCAEGKQETSLGAINSMDSHLQDVEEAASGNEHGKERDPALECGRHQVNPVEGQKTQLKSSGAGGRQAGGPHSYSCLGHTNFESKNQRTASPQKLRKSASRLDSLSCGGFRANFEGPRKGGW